MPPLLVPVHLPALPWALLLLLFSARPATPLLQPPQAETPVDCEPEVSCQGMAPCCMVRLGPADQVG